MTGNNLHLVLCQQLHRHPAFWQELEIPTFRKVSNGVRLWERVGIQPLDGQLN
jgi:hypothetical protein